MTVEFKKATYEGGRLCLYGVEPITARHTADKYQDGKYVAEIKKYRKKRSLTANAYLWVLCDKISQVVKTVDKVDVYKDAIEHLGVCDIINIRQDALQEFVRHWSAHGIGWFSKKIDEDGDYITLAVYSGSSTYDSAQMANLIDWIVQLAKDLDIETLPPDEILLMKERWKDER